jgi:hypothetical protein
MQQKCCYVSARLIDKAVVFLKQQPGRTGWSEYDFAACVEDLLLLEMVDQKFHAWLETIKSCIVTFALLCNFLEWCEEVCNVSQKSLILI